MSAQQKHSPRDLILRYFQEERDNKGNQRNSSSELYPPSVKKPKSSQLNRHVAFNKQRIYQESAQVKKDARKSRECLSSCLITRSPLDSRFKGGANNPAERSAGRLPRTDSECQFKAPGIDFLTERDTNITTHEVKMDTRLSAPLKKKLANKCDFFPKYVVDRPFKEQATQTLYRESSAQTLAYLPNIEDQDIDEHVELFKLPSALPGDKPPGLYEVEVLERSRRRWAFNEALTVNLKKQLDEARELAMQTKYKSILEAFEWESWIEREEYIQECQRMRLEIVIKMFDKREKEMHTASTTRMEMACERIEKSRQRGLHKNEIEYQRGKRRNDIQLAKTSRRWQKQSPMYALGSPCSEFYGPLIRHGVDPARRNFPGTNRKAFDIRMDDLEKRVNLNNMTCPFRRLKEWSKPKEYIKEYEQNFCSDKNLQKLYDSLKALRTLSYENKTPPKCLKKRFKPRVYSDRVHMDSVFSASPSKPYAPETPKKAIAPFDLKYEPDRSSAFARRLQDDRRQVDLEYLLQTYEGTHIGWLMQFLSEEMARLKEQRRLHFFTNLVQKERWRREANEAGLRQKENEMRRIYDELFQKSNSVHNHVSNEYINTILTQDMTHIAVNEAAKTVTGLAKEIDADIERWLESFKLIQTPLTYAPLRLMLRDMVSPDMNAALDRHEKSLIVNYIVEDVIFGRVWEELEPIDIAGTLTSDFIDRLIDNDLYLFSTDSESETPQRSSWYEAQAIIRKLIRQAVPGQRWKEETERIVHENQNDLFDDVFAEIMNKIENPLPVLPSQLINLRRTISNRSIRMTDDIRGWEKIDYKAIREQPSQPDTELLRIQLLNLFKRMTEDKVTRELDTLDIYQGDDHLTEDRDVHIETQVFQHAVNKSEDNAWEPDAQKAAEVEAEVEVEEEAENEPEEEPESEEGIDMEFEDKLGAYYMSEADDEFENDNETDNSSDRIYSEELEEELSIPKEELTEPVGLTKGKKSQVKIITQEVVTEIIDQSPIQLLDPEEHEADLRAGGSVFKTSFNSTASHVASEYNLIQPIEHQTSDQILHEKPTTAKEVGKVVSRTGSQRSQRSQRK
ncbi:cilia- and flagella-associated protein 91-like isoform X5 [Drosophila subobscura]|uniref:cilia- and flagella-associated protein 91-like isoform X5 n=1 Tax=Drosophila subobscura TaxID=7241 RepID=UPI00155AA1F7|nr:cilia- and flagella-associated protein 91-like isoform X5 [Drosophila subobscura]